MRKRLRKKLLKQTGAGFWAPILPHLTHKTYRKGMFDWNTYKDMYARPAEMQALQVTDRTLRKKQRR